MVFGVFDGHGGKEVAEYCKDHFADHLKAAPAYAAGNYGPALRQTFLALDAALKQEDYSTDTGSTSVVVLITPDRIFCANAGDSRAVLWQSTGKAVGLSEDHKPDNADELKRIIKSGHSVEDSRVDGNLALSRALGDYQYKDAAHLGPEDQAVTACPDVTERARSADDDFIIVACDGIWDCLSNEECCKKLDGYVRDMQPAPENYCPPVERMLEDICAPNTDDGIGTDNMTAILIKIHQG